MDINQRLTEELKKQILAAETLVAVEDLYRPYRPKRRTRATIAKEKGLEPLAALITLQKTKEPLEKAAEAYISKEKGVESAKDAISGACDIIAESISDEAVYRTWIRETTMRKGKVTSQAKDPEAESVYEMYYEFEEAVAKLAGHRILALNRGEKEKFLTVKVEAPEEDILRYLERKVIRTENPYTTPVLKETIADSYNRLIGPAIEREVRNELTEKAEDGAIEVFGKNLHQLLMQPPIAGKVVLGWDPAFRTGCKLAVVDETGKVIGTTVIYPTAPTTEKKIQASKDLLKKIIPKYHISLISLGNGTASRESEQFIVELLKEIPEKVQYVIVNEAGASVYSASKLATEEFPKFDVGQRSAASIARRLQDPLAELVKIDPKSIGVGQYQHDMNQKKLGESLNGVVEDCVNKVGVDLNTASAPLLSYISGISSAIAKNIVIEDQLSRNGAKVIKNSIKIYAPDGSDITRQCTITAGENKYVIETGKNLSYDESIKVSYQVKLKEASLSGKTLKNTATGKADFVKPARAVRLVKIKKESKSTVTTGNKADRSNTSEYKRTPGTRDAASTPKTGDSFDEKWIFALLAASLGGSFIYWKKKKKH